MDSSYITTGSSMTAFDCAIGRDRKRSSKLLAITTGLLLLVSACSKNDSILDSSSGNSAPSASMYLPANQSYGASFIVTDSAGNVIRQESYSISGATIVSGNPGAFWNFNSSLATEAPKTAMIYWTENGVYLTPANSAIAECLISAPLVVGAKWNRWQSVDSSSTNGGGNAFDSLGGGGNGGSGVGIEDDKPEDDDNPQNASGFPTEGSSVFYIASISDNVQSGQKSYSNCLQVVNVGVGETVNRYWYSPGFGLVKYALNCKFGEMSGKVNAELLSTGGA